MPIPVKCQKCGATVSSKEEWGGHCPKNLNDEGKSIGHGLSQVDALQFMDPQMARGMKVAMETPTPDTCAWCMAIGNGMVPGTPTLGRHLDANGRVLDVAFCEQYGHRKRMRDLMLGGQHCFSIETIKAWLDADCQPDPEIHFKPAGK